MKSEGDVDPCRSTGSARLVQILIVFIPWPLKRVIYERMLGWTIHKTARIGLSLVCADSMIMGANSRIGHFSVLNNLKRVRIAEYATVGQWNWISAAPMFKDEAANSQNGGLDIGHHSAITSRHYIDCSGGVEIGDFTTIAGVRSTILSHQIDFAESRQSIYPVIIGSYCFIGSNVNLTPGTVIEDKIVVAMGAVVSGHLNSSETLYAGVPAKPIKKLSGAKYFGRRWGAVDFTEGGTTQIWDTNGSDE